MTLPDRITFRPGILAGALAKYCGKHECTPSEATRLALAKMLNMEPPTMPEGNPAFRVRKKKSNRSRGR